ncbi:MAG: hypothetical protein WC262_10325 [Bacteroidales bacterium]|jgi:hypothetical protein
MDDEKLDLIRRLQGVIKKNMGEPHAGDLYYCPLGSEDHKIRVLEEDYFDSMQYDRDGHLGKWVKSEPCCPDTIILIPDLYSRDESRSERGLWGMVDWKRWAISLGIDGSMVLDDMDDPSEGNRYSTDWNTPTLALLKALAWQEGV